MSRSPARLGLVALATGAVLLLLPGSMLAAEPSRNDSVVFQANADVTVPAGTQRDVVIAMMAMRRSAARSAPSSSSTAQRP